MLIRATKKTLKTFIWLTTLVVFIASGLFLRLYIAPVDLSFAHDEIAARVQAELPGWDVSFGDASIGWDFAHMRPWLSMRDVRGQSDAARLDIDVASVDMRLSRYTLLGRPGLAEMTIEGARIVVAASGDAARAAPPDDVEESTRPALRSAGEEAGKGESSLPTLPPGFQGRLSENGQTQARQEEAPKPVIVDTLFNKDGSPDPAAFQPLAALVLDAAQTLSRNTPDLHHVTVNKSLVILDRGDRVARFDVSRLRAELIETDLYLDGRVGSVLGGQPARVHLVGQSDQAAGRLDVALELSELVPAAMATHFNLAGPLNFIEIPVGLEVAISMGRTTGLEQAQVLATLGRGRIVDPHAFPVPARIRHGSIAARYASDTGLVRIDQILLGLAPGDVTGEGVLYWEEGGEGPGVEITAMLDAVSIKDILTYWPYRAYPNGLPRGGRAWISKHMLDGVAKNAVVRLALSPDGRGGLDAGSPWDIVFDFEDIDTYVLQSVPPIYGARGKGYVRADRLELAVTDARLDGLTLGESLIILEDINIKGQEVAKLDLDITGDLQTVFSVLDRHPLQVPTKVKIPTTRLRADVRAHAKLSVPFAGERSNEITYDVEAEATNAEVDDILDGEGVRGGVLTMALDNDALHVVGTGALNGVPLAFDWREDFKAGREDSEAPTTVLLARGQADAVSLEALKVPISRYVDGPVGFEAAFSGRNLQLTGGTFEADLSLARLVLDEIAWEKEPGLAARTKGGLRLAADGGGAVEDMVLTGEDLDASVDLAWSAGGGDLKVAIDARAIGENVFVADVHQTGDTAFDVRVTAQIFDLRPFIDLVDEEEAEAIDLAAAVKDEAEADFTLTADVERILFLNGEIMQGAKVDLAFEAGAPAFAMVTGAFKDDAVPVQLTVTGEDPQARILDVSSSNGGELMRGMGYFSHLHGGTLRVQGTMQGWGDTLEVDAEMQASDALLVPKSALSPEITIGVLDGLEEIVDPEGVTLKRISMPFTFRRGLLDVDKLVANGSSVGMTMEGQIETNLGKVNVNGVFVPAYGINSLLGNIPLLGGLFRGGEGEGLIGFAYRVRGSTADPDVIVSAASGFAPGFLRGIFEGSKGKVEDVTLPDEQAEDQAPASGQKDR